MFRFFYVFAGLALLLLSGCEKIREEKAKIGFPAGGTSAGASLNQAAQSQDELKFVSLYSIEGTICIPGLHDRGIPVTLLQKGQADVFQASTGERFDYNDELNGPDSCTKLVSAPVLTSIRNYSFGVLGNHVERYRLEEVKTVPDDALGKALDRKIRSTDILQKLLMQNSGAAYDENKDLAAAVPAVDQYIMPGVSVYIVSYFMSWGNIPGPRVIVIDDILYPLTGQCSYKEMRGYSINGTYYLETGSSCCECGITGSELYRIDRSGPILVYSDYSSSN